MMTECCGGIRLAGAPCPIGRADCPHIAKRDGMETGVGVYDVYRLMEQTEAMRRKIAQDYGGFSLPATPHQGPEPKGCICPPGSEATCQRSDCGRKDRK